jgi:myo-inositol-1(or 4)-monophosphatase
MSIDEVTLDLETRTREGGRIARRAGRAASALRESLGMTGLTVENKGLQDFVTVADRRTEQYIRRALGRRFPGDGFIGEETGGLPKGNFWVVDPIDGTTNYIRGFRHWGVSMAFVGNGRLEAGIIYDAALDSIYAARRGGGATKDGVPIRAAGTIHAARAVAILGHSRRTNFDDYLEVSRRLYEREIDYRRMGAAAIGLARVANGIADLYYEQHLNAWDVLAGALIAHEAGATVLMPALEEVLKGGGGVLAMAPGLAGELDFLRDTLPGCRPL